MCGRFSLTSPPESMRVLFDYKNMPNMQPRYNVAPTQSIAAVRVTEGGARELAMLRWGLIPSWARDGGMGAKMINARAETVAEKPAFREAFRARRCLVPADGFYEWRLEDGKKQPFRIGMKGGGAFAFAGLWESWTARQDGYGYKEGDCVESVTIITTDANRKIHPIHHRMPVILEPGDYAAWLEAANDREILQSLLKPFPEEPMAFYRVGLTVNNVRNDNSDCLQPLATAAGK
jgi:putative SOS response-associated peptidase YedK